jgi:integrase/recombinase XerD
MVRVIQCKKGGVGTPRPAPVEYSAAIDRYLAATDLGRASRRVYRISLLGWSWPLVGRRAPTGRDRRGAHPPVVPLALLDDPKAPERLQQGLTDRASAAKPRTLTRELACLRAATAWWLAEGWITADPAVGLAPPAPCPGPIPNASGASTPARVTAADPDRAHAVLALRAPLRELTLWHLLHESRAPVEQVLALNIDDLDLVGRRTRTPAATSLSWGRGTARLLPMLLAGRTAGPVFVTDRRAPAPTPAADRCPVTGRGRLSYRRAAELFTAATRPLDPARRGWTLLVLRDRPPRNRSVPR